MTKYDKTETRVKSTGDITTRNKRQIKRIMYMVSSDRNESSFYPNHKLLSNVVGNEQKYDDQHRDRRSCLGIC